MFVFVADRQAQIEDNYGLEGALPDAVSKRIIEDEILPHFPISEYAGGRSHRCSTKRFSDTANAVPRVYCITTMQETVAQ